MNSTITTMVHHGTRIVNFSCGPILKYCPACHFHDEDFAYSGSRYGLVGHFRCENCGEHVKMVDDDLAYSPIRYYCGGYSIFGVGVCNDLSTVIDYSGFYGLKRQHFAALEKALDFELLEWDDIAKGGGSIDFEPIVARAEVRLIAQYGVIEPFDVPHPFITRVPEIYFRWLSILTTAVGMANQVDKDRQ